MFSFFLKDNQDQNSTAIVSDQNSQQEEILEEEEEEYEGLWNDYDYDYDYDYEEEEEEPIVEKEQERTLLSCSQCQEFSQLKMLWLLIGCFVLPIRPAG